MGEGFDAEGSQARKPKRHFPKRQTFRKKGTQSHGASK